MERENKSSRTAPAKKPELRFNEDNGPVDRAIYDVFKLAGGIHNPEIIREIILAALKAGQENP